MLLDPADLDGRELYFLLTSCVVPRPIAWVTTCSTEGIVNAAPFSFFNGVSSDPPILSIAIGRRRGEKKDTLVNIEGTGEFVVNVVDASMGEKMVATAGDYPPDVSEVTELDLAVAPCEQVAPPRLADSPISMECRLERVIELGNGPTSLILGEVIRFHIRDGLLVDGQVDRAGWQPLGRLAGRGYSNVTDAFDLR